MRVPIEEAYIEKHQKLQNNKKNWNFQPSKTSAVTPRKREIAKNGSWKKLWVHQKRIPILSQRWVERTSTHKYTTKSRTKIFNYVITFKMHPKCFKWMQKKKKNTHRHELICSHRLQKRRKHSGPMANHINCKTTRKLLRYRDPVNMDELAWTNSMCNELNRLSQVWKTVQELTR